MKSTVKTIGYLLGFLIFLGLAKQIGKETAKATIKSFKGNTIDKGDLLIKLVQGMNTKIQLPLNIDKEISLVKIYAEGEDILVYEYITTAESINVIGFKPILFDRIKHNIGKTAKQIGISIIYKYKSKSSGKIIGVIM